MPIYVDATVDGRAARVPQEQTASLNTDQILDALVACSIGSAIGVEPTYYGILEDCSDDSGFAELTGIEPIGNQGLVRFSQQDSLPLATANDAGDGYIYSAMNEYSANQPAYQAADKIFATTYMTHLWHSTYLDPAASPTNPVWWQIEFPEPAMLYSFMMATRNDGVSYGEIYAPNTFKVYGTNSANPGTDYTAAEWTEVLDVPVFTWLALAETKHWSISELKGLFQKYRVVITNIQGNDTNRYCAISEIDMGVYFSAGDTFVAKSVVVNPTGIPTKASFFMWGDFTGTLTDEVMSNNDIRVEITFDGTTWVPAPLTYMGVEGGHDKYVSNVQNPGSGNALQYRVASYLVGSELPDAKILRMGFLNDGSFTIEE